MSPLFSALMNHAHDLTHSQNFVVGKLAPNFLMLAAGIPLELLAMIEHIVALSINTAVKIPLKIMNTYLPLKATMALESSTEELCRTAFKIVGYAMGIISTLFVGGVRPILNYRLHASWELIHNEEKRLADLKQEAENNRQYNAERQKFRDDLDSIAAFQTKKRLEELEKLEKNQINFSSSENSSYSINDTAPDTNEGSDNLLRQSERVLRESNEMLNDYYHKKIKTR